MQNVLPDEQQDNSNPFTAELVIKPGPSRLLLLFIFITHLCTIAAVSIVPGLGSGWRFVLVAAVIASLGHCCLSHRARSVKNAHTLYWREFGGWELIDGQGQHLPVILLNSSFSQLYVSVLNFKTRPALGGRRYTVILLPDNCPLIIRRCLRIRMKLYAA